MLESIKQLYYSRQSLKKTFDSAYRPTKLATRAESTIKAYEITLRHFDRYLERSATLGDLNDATVCQFASTRRSKVAARTVNRDINNLLAFWRWLAAKRIVKLWPADVELYVAPKLIPKALTHDEIDAVWHSIHQGEGYVGRVDIVTFFRALFLVFWDTGERFSGVMGIRVEDFDEQKECVIVRHDTRKGGREDRLYPLHEQTKSAIMQLLAELGNVRRNSQLFHVPYSKEKIWQLLGEIMERAGLPNDREHKTHVIRKSNASHLHAAGGDATEQLGHSTEKITRQNYFDPRVTGGRQAVELLFRPGARTA